MASSKRIINQQDQRALRMYRVLAELIICLKVDFFTITRGACSIFNNLFTRNNSLTHSTDNWNPAKNEDIMIGVRVRVNVLLIN